MEELQELVGIMLEKAEAISENYADCDRDIEDYELEALEGVVQSLTLAEASSK
jgi:hypothetical protein|tara:strand:- start:10907 stop:11065 length:159 start_codon:yes stop_codon:yes gene_type:complete